MKSADLEVLTRALEWLESGYKAHLFTVVQTWVPPRVYLAQSWSCAKMDI